MKDGLMSTRACHTFPSSCVQVDSVLDHKNLRVPQPVTEPFFFRPNAVEFVSAEACEFLVLFFL